MPNWCENDLIVTGKREDVEAFLAAASGFDHGADKKTEENPLCFDKFIPYPQKFLDMDAAAEKRREEIKAMSEEERAKLKQDELWPKDGYNQGGYEWCVANWGTKWCACHTRKPEVKDGKRTVKAVIGFDTALVAAPAGHPQGVQDAPQGQAHPQVPGARHGLQGHLGLQGGHDRLGKSRVIPRQPRRLNAVPTKEIGHGRWHQDRGGANDRSAR